MSPYASTALVPRSVEVNDFALTVSLYFASSGSQSSIQLLVASLSFGILTALVTVAIIFLVRQGLRSRISVAFLFLSTLLLYSSTSIYMCALVWYRLRVSQLVLDATKGLTSTTYDASGNVASFERVVEIQSWMMTMTTGTNVSTLLCSPILFLIPTCPPPSRS
ncbi:hypothetical protein BD311DRAFT_316530 [Dichomitus squalens]|uniref:Uncharacterized protein n=1 Tax=Dichomitus squalens TaxID=114155 RepID=A0A4Q9MN63_9APHY|nr:hypothetical protein BD311DRAFT_316530 [Dichomitus squalens]